MTISKQMQKQIVNLYKGTKTSKGMRNARKIAQTLNLPRRKVMAYLTEQKIARYSSGSFL